MGKVKKKKFSAQKPRPTGLPSVGECEAEIELQQTLDGENSIPSTLQTVIEKLQSPNVENRESACTTIANFVSQPGAIAGLLKLNVVKILGPLVLDTNWDVRHRALGALRNLSVDGGDKVCTEMIQKDVLTPVLALISQIGSCAFSEVKNMEKQKDMVWEAYSNAFYLLSYLCEGSDTAVEQVNREKLVPILTAVLGQSYSIALQIAVAEFLHTVTEDNAAFCHPELVECMQRLMSEPGTSPQQLLLSTLATGILLNLEGSRLSTARADLVIPIVTSISQVLSHDIRALLLVPNGDVKCETETGTSNGAEMEEQGTINTEHVENVVNKKMEDIENLLKAQKVALEIAANLCCTDDDDWEDMNNSESSSDDAMEVPMDDCEAGADNFTPLCVSTELHAAYVKCDIVSKVLQCAQPLTEEQCQCLNHMSGAKHIHSRFQGTQVHALLCLNNLVSSLDTEALGGVLKLHTVWLGLNQLCNSQSCTEHQQMLEAVTSAMRAVTQKLADSDPAKFESVQPSDLQFLYEMSTKCQWSEVRVNALRIIATIGSILSKNMNPHPLLKDVGMFLLEVVCKDSNLWVVAESLDSIFDVFGEDHVDPVVREIGMIDKLRNVAPVLKSKMQENKRSLGEHYPVISMARTNLVRFIKYKMSH